MGNLHPLFSILSLEPTDKTVLHCAGNKTKKNKNARITKTNRGKGVTLPQAPGNLKETCWVHSLKIESNSRNAEFNPVHPFMPTAYFASTPPNPFFSRICSFVGYQNYIQHPHPHPHPHLPPSTFFESFGF